MKRVIPGTKEVDISRLEQSDRAVVYDHLDRVEKFAVDIDTIRNKKVSEASKLVADNLVKSFKSRQASFFAESEIIAAKVSKGNITLLAVSSGSTDAYYIQEKIGGLYVRLEIKSVTQPQAAAVDKEIANAEAQHRDRLHDEQGKPTWHKTTIIIGNDNNSWPCRNMKDFELLRNNHGQLLAIAEHHLQKLVMGSVKPGKKLERQPTRIIMKHLTEAEVAQTNAEKVLLQQENESITRLASREVAASPKRSLPPNPTATPEKMSLTGNTTKSSLSPTSEVTTPSKRPLPPDPPKPAVLPATKPSMQLRFGRTASRVSKPPPPPPSPISQRIISRKQELKALAEENRKLEAKTRIKRRLLVTEQVTVICPHLNMTFVLNREAGKFVAHLKGNEKPLGQAKRERKHWNIPPAFRERWRKSANTEGNNPLHLAVQEQKEDLVRFFMKNSLMRSQNNAGDFPIHIAVTTGNKSIVRLLATDNNQINKVNKEGKTALELAQANGNDEIAKILIEFGAENVVKSEKKL